MCSYHKVDLSRYCCNDHCENVLQHILFCFLFRYIDQGKNPQLYTKDCMEKALTKNEAVKGKIDAFKVRGTLTRLYCL